MNDKNSTFKPDPQTLEYVIKQLEEVGVQYTGCPWGTRFQGIRFEDGQLVAANSVTAMPDGKFYRATLVERIKPDGSTYRSLMLIENNSGRDKIGDVVLEIRLDPGDGRYKIHVQEEQVFSDEVNFEMRPRAVRSSIDNENQALKRRTIDIADDGIRSNPARIAGLKIAQHFSYPAWGANLPADEYMDVFDYIGATDAMGHSTLLKGLQLCSSSITDEIYAQLKDPDRRKIN